jgi:hypothetical protein
VHNGCGEAVIVGVLVIVGATGEGVNISIVCVGMIVSIEVDEGIAISVEVSVGKTNACWRDLDKLQANAGSERIINQRIDRIETFMEIGDLPDKYTRNPK